MAAVIAGLGQVSAVGGGIGALRQALGAPPPEPTWLPCPDRPEARGAPALLANDAGTEGLVSPRAARRLDGLSRRALCAARLALQDAAVEMADPERVGVLMTTGYGALASTFAFLDDVIDKGDGLASPLLFSRSVHNAPAFTISSALGIRGPTLTVTGFGLPWAQGLATALDWLERQVVDQVLLGSADEAHPIIACGQGELGQGSPDGRSRPLDLLEPSQVAGETYTAMVLQRGPAAASSWGTIETPRFRRPSDASVGHDEQLPRFIAACGDPRRGKGYLDALNEGTPVAAYGALWGANPTADAMTVLAAAISLADQTVYPMAPSPSVTGGLRPLPPGRAALDAIGCVTADPTGRTAEITVRRSPPSR